MMTYVEFMESKQNELGFYPDEKLVKVQTSIDQTLHEYLAYIARIECRYMKYHINKAVLMYCQQLTKKYQDIAR